jgi:hypothetical protein
MENITEEVTVALPKEMIEFDLAGYAVTVSASDFNEDGWLLILEGDAMELSELLSYWQDAGVLVAKDAPSS